MPYMESEVVLTFVIFYCFEFSVCCHFVILISLSSFVVIHFSIIALIHC